MKPRLAEALSGWLGFAVPLPDYGHLLSLALLIGLFWTERRLLRVGLSEKAPSALLLSAVAGIYVGAKLLYLAQYPGELPRALQSPLLSLRSGYSLYGGLAGLMAGAVLAARRQRLPASSILDAMTPSLALGLAITRVGCFLAGCNFGRPTALAWAVRFPSGSPAWSQQVTAGLLNADSPLSLPVHPTQLYESALGVLLCLAAVALAPRLSGRGGLFLTLVAIYALFRGPEESIRADAGGVAFGSLTFSQGISLALVLAAVAGICWQFKSVEKDRKKPPGEPGRP